MFKKFVIAAMVCLLISGWFKNVNVEQLYAVQDYCSGISVSPDNKKVVISTTSGYEIFDANLSKRLGKVDYQDSSMFPVVEWSPNGKKIALIIEHNPKQDVFAVYDLNETTLGAKHEVTSIYDFIWSEDSSKLFINLESGCMVLNGGSNKLESLSLNSKAVKGLEFLGERIAIYASKHDKDETILVQSRRGKIIETIWARDIAVAPSPNHQLIAYNVGPRMEVISLSDGKKMFSVLDGARINDRPYVQWSPKATKFSYITTDGDLWIADVKTKERKKLLTIQHNENYEQAFSDVPVWVNERTIAAVYSKSNMVFGESTYIVYIDTKTGFKLTKKLPVDRIDNICWSNDGNYLYFSDLGTKIYRLKLGWV